MPLTKTGMALDRITLSAFRNHRESRLGGAGKLNLLIGENGAGKTNVLEALSLFAPGRGLRRAQLAEMAMSGGGGGFAVSAELSTGGDAESVLLGTSHSCAGNPMRFRTGEVRLVADDGWRRSAAPAQTRLVTALTAPLLVRYQYPLTRGADR